MSNKQTDEIIEKQKYTYTVTEQSVDERITEISSTVKLTWDEIQSIYLEAFDDDKKVVKGLEGYVEWSDERFTDDEILNKIKIEGSYQGIDYGENCELYINGDIEEEEANE